MNVTLDIGGTRFGLGQHVRVLKEFKPGENEVVESFDGWLWECPARRAREWAKAHGYTVVG